MRKRMPRLEWLRYSAFVLLYPLGCAGEIGVIEATIKHMTEPRESLFQLFYDFKLNGYCIVHIQL